MSKMVCPVNKNKKEHMKIVEKDCAPTMIFTNFEKECLC